jgi:BirA family biotin operon repressor/biotin-[acetyl-CoA-carboxylase] ligase
VDRAGRYRVETFDTLGSTNDEAMARLKAGDPGGLIIVARSQTGGRGRQGRVWASPPGNLYATLALADPGALAMAPQIGFVAGVALATALRRECDGDERLKLKWPNDLLFDGAKLAGLLLESASLPGDRIACVIGFGVNCLSHPTGLPYRATNISAAGYRIDAAAVLAAVAVELERQLEIWDRGRGFAATRSSWLALAAGLGEPIEVATAHGRRRGLFKGIDPAGRLMLIDGGARVLVDAGDVFLSGAIAAETQNKRCDATGR